MSRIAIATGLVVGSLLQLLQGANLSGKAPYEPTWESVNRHNPGGTAPEWFRDAKFGIYFHWGAYSVPAFRASSFGEWYPKTMNTTGSGENLHHIKTYGDPSAWPYENFLLAPTTRMATGCNLRPG